MSASYGLDDYVADLRRITAETTDESEMFDRLGPCAQRSIYDPGTNSAEAFQVKLA